VSVEGASQVVGIDLGSHEVVARVRVPFEPGAIASSNDLRQFLVAGEQAGKVALIDGITHRLLKVFSGFGRPAGVAFGPGADSFGHSRYAYVTDEQRGQLDVIDLRRLAVVSRVPVGQSPHSIVVGDLIWVTHGTGEPFVTALALNRPARPQIVDRIAAGGPALAVVPQADSITVDLSYTTGQIGAIDTGTHLLLWSKRLTAPAYGLAADYIGRRLLWTTEPALGTTLLLSAKNGRTLRTLTGCPGAHGVEPIGAWLVVACHQTGTVALYDTRTWRTTLIPVGAGAEDIAAVVAP
jgi:hypothetical protein